MSMYPLILICDDDPVVHESLGLYLGSEGYEHQSAYDGQQALEMVENELAAAKVADSVVVGINLANHTSVTEGAFRRRNWQDFSRAMGYLVKKWKEFPAFAGVAIGPFLRLELIQEEE